MVTTTLYARQQKRHMYSARTWKQLRCLSTNAWIKKLWYIYTVKYYSAIKRNTFESVLMRWMDEPRIYYTE